VILRSTENHRKVRYTHPFFTVMTLLMRFGTITCTALIMFARAATLLPSGSSSRDRDSGKLNMLTTTTEKIEGIYLTPNQGIHFLSEAYESSRRFFIAAMDGNPMVSAERKESATLISVVGKEFLLVGKGSSNVDDYFVPAALSRRIENTFRKHGIGKKLLRRLDRSVVNATRNSAFKELLNRPEVELVVAAAKALGSTGLRGRENPAALTFYAFAKQLAKVKTYFSTGPEGGSGEPFSSSPLPYQHMYREKRYQLEECTNIQPSGFLFSNNRYCPRGECPIGSECYGMCGIACSSCWDFSFICDDCCFHRGCYDHDLCCARDGFFSWSCLTVPFSFNCDGYDCSQGCNPNPCLNGGICTEQLDSFICNCSLGFTGSICERRRWCIPDPCQNGGTCVEQAYDYTCECAPQYTGNTCEERLWCVPSPCQNGGTCFEEADNFTCSCPPQYTGDTCEEVVGCIPDPCQNGGNCTEGSSGFNCTCPPTYIGVYCEQYDHCHSNPCQNGGHCSVLSSNTYECNCEGSNGAGLNCEHRVGNLRVYARGGTGLPDEDPWFNDSDPYLEVIAYDHLGNSVRKRTDDDSGDQSPEWNEWLNFGSRAWRRFSVKVWDEDLYSDDALSSTQTYYLNSPISRCYVRFNCYSGFVQFDYYFD